MTRLANPTRTSLDARASAASPMAGPKGVASPRTVARSADDADASASAVSASSALDSDASELNFERTRWSSATTAERGAPRAARRARGTRRAGSAPTRGARGRGAAPPGSAAPAAARSVAESTRSREPRRQRVHLRLGPPAVGVVEQAHVAPTAASHEGDAVADAASSRRRGGARPRRPAAAEGAAARDAASANSSPSPAESRPASSERGAARGRARRGTSSPDTRAPQRAPPGARPAPR